MIIWHEIPVELQDLVLANITDTNTICKARLVCHQWKDFWDKIPWYQDYLKMGYFVLQPNHFWLEDLSGLMIREIKFKSYGRWCYQEFTPSGQIERKIENKSFFMIESMDNSDDFFRKIRKVDARVGSVNEIQIPKVIMGPQCLIS